MTLSIQISPDTANLHGPMPWLANEPKASDFPTEGYATVPLKDCSDSDLMRRVSRQDADALAELFDRHGSSLQSLALRILHSLEDAEEILQEVLLHAWTKAGNYDAHRSSVLTWLFLITRSRAIDRLRSQRSVERTIASVRRESKESQSLPEAGLSLLNRQRKIRVQAALARLPDDQRRVLELSFFQGMSHSQISIAQGIPLGTVKTRIVLAMQKLRRTLRFEINDLL